MVVEGESEHEQAVNGRSCFALVVAFLGICIRTSCDLATPQAITVCKWAVRTVPTVTTLRMAVVVLVIALAWGLIRFIGWVPVFVLVVFLGPFLEQACLRRVAGPGPVNCNKAHLDEPHACGRTMLAKAEAMESPQ